MKNQMSIMEVIATKENFIQRENLKTLEKFLAQKNINFTKDNEKFNIMQNNEIVTIEIKNISVVGFMVKKWNELLIQFKNGSTMKVA